MTTIATAPTPPSPSDVAVEGKPSRIPSRRWVRRLGARLSHMVDRASTIVVEGRGEAVASDGRPFSAIVVGTAAVGFAAFVASLAAAFGVLLASVAESALSLSLVLWEASAR